METPDPYLIDAAARILDVLDLFTGREELRLKDVIDELGLVKSTAFRLLYTLEQKGYIERIKGGRAYQRRRRHRIGLLSISTSLAFVAEVESGIEREARRAGVDLALRHHEFDADRLVAAVGELLSSGISLLLCYNPNEHISHVIADRCTQAGVPVIAITFPVPGARVFGINNYRAGLSGGEGLGEQVSRRWGGHVDKVMVLDIPGSSPAQQARITGMLEGLRKYVAVPDEKLLHLHTERRTGSPQALVAAMLQQHPRARHIAMLCYNDVNALYAVRAVEAAGRSAHAAILSQGAVAEVRQEIRRAQSPLWSAVAHFPERFGEKLMPLVTRLLRGEAVPNSNYTEHIFLTRSNMSRHYNDSPKTAASLPVGAPQ